MTTCKMDFSGLPMASKTAQRLPPKTSGPFNEVITGVADDPVTSVDDIFDMETDELPARTLSQSDWSNLLRSDDALLGDLNDVFDLNLEGTDGLEDFVDISELLSGNPHEATVVNAGPAPPCTSIDGTTSKGKKRKCSIDHTSTQILVVPSDHSGYTSKRLRLTSIASATSVSETDSEIVMTDLTPKEKHTMRRQKNNVASKRSRESRKHKYVKMESEAGKLEKANEALREKITKLEEMAKEMKEILIKRMVDK